jgi:hypothetical protein
VGVDLRPCREALDGQPVAPGALAVSPAVLFEGLEFVPSDTGQGHFTYAVAEQEPAA